MEDRSYEARDSESTFASGSIFRVSGNSDTEAGPPYDDNLTIGSATRDSFTFDASILGEQFDTPVANSPEARHLTSATEGTYGPRVSSEFRSSSTFHSQQVLRDKFAGTESEIMTAPRHDVDSISAKTAHNRLSLDEYAEKLLAMERMLNGAHQQCEQLRAEKSDLERRLASVEEFQDARSSMPGSIAEHTPNNRPAVDHNPQSEAVSTLQIEVLALRGQVQSLEDDNSKKSRLISSLKSKLDSMKTAADGLRSELAGAREDARDYLAKHSVLAQEHVALQDKYNTMEQKLSESMVSGLKNLESMQYRYEALQAEHEDLMQTTKVHQKAARYWQGIAQTGETELLYSNENLKDIASSKPEQDSESARNSEKHDPSSCEALNLQCASKDTSGNSDCALSSGKYPEKVNDLSGESNATKESDAISQAQELIEVQAELAHCKDRVAFLAANLIALQSAKAADGTRRDLSLAQYSHGEGDSWAEHQDSFLRRLSERVGAWRGPSSEKFLLLTDQVKALLSEKGRLEESIEQLRDQKCQGEREMKRIRSELSSEISALKADLASAEDECCRAVQERERAEQRLVEFTRIEVDLESTIDSPRQSLSQDLRLSTPPRRGAPSNPLDCNPETNRADDASKTWRRYSRYSDSMVLGNDPAITAALDSLKALIESKEAILERNKLLKEKLLRAIRTGNAGASNSAASVKALAIESKFSNEELTAVVDEQERIIEKLLPESSSLQHRRQLSCIANETPTRSSIRVSSSGSQRVTSSPSGYITVGRSAMARRYSGSSNASVAKRESCHRTVEYLQDDLKAAREKYDELSKTNVNLQKTILQMQDEINAILKERQAVDDTLAAMQKQEKTAAEAGDIEPYHAELRTSDSNSSSLWEARYELVLSRLCRALAQKCFLAQVIYLYQSKYQLDIFASSDTMATPMTKFRRVYDTVLACLRLRRLFNQRSVSGAAIGTNVQVYPSLIYSVPSLVNLTRRGEYCVELTSAVVAITGVARLQRALDERDAELRQLKSSMLQCSNAPVNDCVASCDRCDKENRDDGFNHNEDLVARKQELARKVKKLQRQKEEMSMELSNERKARYAAEANIAMFAHKISKYQNRARKVEHEKEVIDKGYKAAIEYLTERMKAANQPRNRDRNSIDTVVLMSQADSRFGNARETESARPPLQPAVFRNRKNTENLQSHERAALGSQSQRSQEQRALEEDDDPISDAHLTELNY